MEEANQLVDGKLNHIMNHFVFTADIASNEVFTYHQATKQPDWKDFLTAMENELKDHEEREHWMMVEQALMPRGAKTIRAI